MKVLQLVTTPRPFFEQQVAALEERGIDCTVCSVPGSHDGADGRSPTAYARFYAQVLSAVRSTDYDLVHANYGLVAPAALAQPTRPVVLTLWGSDLMSDRPWLRACSRIGARRADATVVPTEVMSDALEADHRVHPFGVDTDQFRPIDRERARERVGWDTDRPVALFPYDPDRDVKDYARARKLVEAADVDLELRTVSGVDHAVMPDYMNASDVLLVTSRRESGPMVVKEAAACNLPVVSTDVGFVRETLADIEGCVVSDDDEPLVSGLEIVVERDASPDGREVIDDLGVDALGDSLAALYREVTGSDASASHSSEVGQRV